LDAFPSRLDIQFKWGRVLDAAIKKDKDIVVALAEDVARMREAGAKLSSSEVFAKLAGGRSSTPSGGRPISHGDRLIGSVHLRGNKVLIELDRTAFPDETLEAVLASIQKEAR
jgi:hypothetical protein